MMFSVGVFLSSSEMVSPFFLEEAEAFGRSLAKANCQVVYGGSSTGMMGRLAQGVLSQGGRIVGVIPQMDFAEGSLQKGLSQVEVVKSLFERKERLLALSDAVVILPGGIGTLDEVFETLVHKMVGEWTRPVVFLNHLDFWAPLLETLTLMVEQRMINMQLQDLYEVCETHKQVLDVILRGNINVATESRRPTIG